jgi:hypothetical protein
VIDANFFAIIALLGVIVSAAILFVARRPEMTCINLVIVACLFLPTQAGIKLPFMELLDRNTLPYLCFFIALVLRGWRPLARGRVGRSAHVYFAIAMAAAVCTWLTNRDTVEFGDHPRLILQPLTFQDSIGAIRSDLVMIVIPFLLGRMVVRSADLGLHLIRGIAIGGLVYSLCILVELRMSPVLHLWLYGRYPGDVIHAMRGSGYRPMVFMQQGLAVAVFMAVAVVAAVTLGRLHKKVLNISWKLWAIYLLLILVACKSTAGLVYALVLAPLVWLARPKRQLRMVALIGTLFLLYPISRGYDLFPTQTLLTVAGKFSDDRAASMATRFDSEKLLIDKVQQRIAFGWGGYGRPNLYHDGHALAIFDGWWIISLSHRGAIYLVVVSLILVAPILAANRKLRAIKDPRDRIILAGLAAMLLASVVDLIPNGLFLNYPFFLAGALSGLTRALLATPPAPAESVAPEPPVASPVGPPSRPGNEPSFPVPDFTSS